jgi:hypothetical protein
MTNYPTDPADILEAAADLLESKGWKQGEFMNAIDPDDATRFCALGAIRVVTGYSMAAKEYRQAGDYATYRERHRHSMEACLALAAKVGQDVPTWNDRPGRTADQVIDVMKHAAKDLRNRAALHE